MLYRNFLLVFILALFMTSCPSCDRYVMDSINKDKISDSDVFFEYENSYVAFTCDPTCPSEEDFIERVNALQCKFKDHITKADAWKSIKGYKFIFTDKEFGAKGMHSPNQNYIMIYYPHPCPDRPQGLCGGVFDWETGNAFMEIVLAQKLSKWGASEKEKLEYRKEYDLFEGCQVP